MLVGLNNIINAVNEPERFGERAIEGLATQGVPLGALQRQINQATGMASRDPHGAIDAMLASTVGGAPLIQSKIDPLGREVVPGQTGIGAFASPYRYGAGPDDPILNELRAAKVNIPAGAKVRRGVPFTPVEERRHQIWSGQLIEKYVAEFQKSPEYAKATKLERDAGLERIVESARTEAAGYILQRMGEAEAVRRIEEERRKEAAVVP